MESNYAEIAARTSTLPPGDHVTIVRSMLTLSTTMVVCSTFSILGASWMILSFVCFKHLRSFRHRLILFLAISDLVMAVNFMAPSASNLSGKLMSSPEQSDFCQLNGFLAQTFIVQTDYWVLVIATTTYFMLAGHKKCSAWVQNHSVVVILGPWVMSVSWAAIGLAVGGYGNIGAWCWFTSDKVRLLINFVPRWIIILAILVMYTRVYFVLFKAQKGLQGSRAQGRPQSGEGPYHVGRSNQQQLKRLARLMMMYPIAYMLIWAIPTASRIWQACTGQKAPVPLQAVDKGCIVLQGFVDAVIYGVNETSLSCWRNLLFPPPFPSSPAQGHNGDKYTCRVSACPLGDEETGESTLHLGAELANRNRSREDLGEVGDQGATADRRLNTLAGGNNGERGTELGKLAPNGQDGRGGRGLDIPGIVVTHNRAEEEEAVVPPSEPREPREPEPREP